MIPNIGSTQALRDLIDDLEANDAERTRLKDLRKRIHERAEVMGFDAAALEGVVKLRAMDPAARARAVDRRALIEIYAASIGSLDGTPLGDAARQRLSRPQPQPKDRDRPGEPAHPFAGAAPLEAPPEDADAEAAPERPPATVADARAQGAAAATAGQSILVNPYIAGDPRRAAWDEGWCETSGSDGMEIPAAWRRAGKKKKPGDDAGSEDGTDESTGHDEVNEADEADEHEAEIGDDSDGNDDEGDEP